jgi:hypothetical protein
MGEVCYLLTPNYTDRLAAACCRSWWQLLRAEFALTLHVNSVLACDRPARTAGKAPVVSVKRLFKTGTVGTEQNHEGPQFGTVHCVRQNAREQ